MKTEMSWDDKIQLATLANQAYKSYDDRQNFHSFILKHYKSFDMQAWDMFITVSNIIAKEMLEDKKFWKTIYPHMNQLNTSSPSLSFRASLRMEIAIMLCETKLNLK